MKLSEIKVIAFDADDTLWHNENYFQEVETAFCQLLEDYLPQHSTERELLKTEIANVSLYGYGIKSFMLSMIETAIRISNGTIRVNLIDRIIQLGKEMLDKPVDKMGGVDEVLSLLKNKYRLVVATKGDLLDQERKLKKSGLEHYFHHVEIMSEKGVGDYQKLIRHLDISPNQFLMIGNSLKSDVLPVLELGGYGFHIPYHITWGHEKVEHAVEHINFKELEKITDVLNYL